MKTKRFFQLPVITILILASILPQSVIAASLPPVNDEIANAKIVNAIPYSDSIDTSLATTSPDDPISCPSYGSVWYQFTPSVGIPISIDTFGSDYDTVLNVFTGQPYPGGLTLVECNDDTDESLQSRVSFIAHAGTTYYIMVGRYDMGEPGDNLQLNVQEAPEIAWPSNDDFVNAKVITSLPFSDTVDITNATPETGEISYCEPNAKTVWYTFTSIEDMWLQIDIYGSSFSDTAFTVYQAYGPNINNLNFVQCANNGNTFTVQAGFTYYIQAGSMDGNGDLQLDLQEVPRPNNDDFVNAEAITSLPFTDSLDNTNATTEPDEPDFCYPSYSHSKTVWYLFTPTVDTVVKAEIQQGGWYNDTIFNVYQSIVPGIGGLSVLSCGYPGNSTTFSVQAGITYYIQAGSKYYDSSNPKLNLQEIPKPVNDDFAKATIISSSPFDDTVNITGATLETGEPTSSCPSYGNLSKTVWYTYTPLADGIVSVSIPAAPFASVVKAYFGNSLTELSQLGCQVYGASLTIPVSAGKTYYFQIGKLYLSDVEGEVRFHFDKTDNLPPVADAGGPYITNEGYLTLDASGSYDPEGAKLLFEWDLDNDGEYDDGTGVIIDYRFPDDGNYQVGLKVTDVYGEEDTDTAEITVTNVSPIVNLAQGASIHEGATFTENGSFSDPGFDSWTATVDYGDGAGVMPLALNPDKTFSLGHTYLDNGIYTVRVCVTDDDGGVGCAVENITVTNVSPIVNIVQGTSINEGRMFIGKGSFSDPGSDTWTATVDYGDGTGVYKLKLNLNKTFTLIHIYSDNGNYPAQVCITDDDGGVGCYTVTVKIDNVSPSIGSIDAPIDPVQVEMAIETNSTFTDPGMGDTHTATWDWGDGMTSEGSVDGYEVGGSHVYDAPGVYTLTLTVEDDDGGMGSVSFEYIVVYDPDGGFVTGGGWIWSPEGAYTPDPSLTGKATFGFVSKYQKGANVPTGDTEFQFNVANLYFESTTYDWLVIAGMKAQFKGTGTINGMGEYKFILTAIDSSPDMFRIKIWDKETGEIIYDNQLGAGDNSSDATELGGGSIVVHK